MVHNVNIIHCEIIKLINIPITSPFLNCVFNNWGILIHSHALN